MNFADNFKSIIDKIGIKKLSILVGGFIIILSIIIFIILMVTRPERTITSSFDHKYLIDYTSGETVSRQIYKDIEEVVFDEEERKSTPIKNPVQKNYPNIDYYRINLIEDSFKTRSDLPDKSYTLNTSVSDERTYTLNYRIDTNYGQSYFVLVIDRTDNKANEDFIYIHTNDSKKSSELEEWAKNTFKDLNNPKIIQKSLELPKGNSEF